MFGRCFFFIVVVWSMIDELINTHRNKCHIETNMLHAMIVGLITHKTYQS